MTAFLGNILGSLLKFIYDMVSQIGTEPANFSFYAMAIIITTIIFKLILLPISLHQSKSSKKMNEIQPKMKEIQNKYKSDPQTMQTKMAELYKEHKYNPASGCLVLLIQFPIIIAFFKVMGNPTTFAFRDPGVYEAMNKTFFWIKDLNNPDPYIWGLPLLAAATTYLQSKTMMTATATTDPQAQATQKMMNMFLPIMIFMAARGFAAGLALYWVISNTFSIIQQLVSNRSLGKVKEEN
ncbi:YidC/Oxa1 family membrane protein insertase [Tissierella praeacuta]|uniref:YidC/Oxa1 family membrane protein insertase n=1 Tax=Tissierella praeacuta DSM 18095 TaxID=1123404 RepID=A0A1M4Z017_9FIRM|nr:YidC/Oxa1 family membrane protein insertase [Tissierella praeacuta]MBU5257157.1 YidC/Oxa1 family membrane protein insertase [Tissierella praeacuta]TCU66250.1 YidC/Oxa1 family membrane protein insertase [Tissierella praeacuta]SHF11330.1 YidC/Oxa1 family membrane protein insertase [Tissierella praeacuta DSM 18095]SUP04947.1 Stage III sporulation protein J [Tissierella praeacuta]